MSGWSAALEEVPDEVFAGRLLGDGVAIDPTEGVLRAPCDGVIVTTAPQKHAVTIQAANGAEILLHVGIDTVALNGEGFELHVEPGARVRAGDRLLTFDLDLLARRATSLLTPIIVTDSAPFRVGRRASGKSVSAGEFLMELTSGSSIGSADVESEGPVDQESVATVIVPLEHGIHARPAARLIAGIKRLSATVSVEAHGRIANGRSAIALMSLGARKGDEVVIRARGPDAAAAVAALKSSILGASETAEDQPRLASSEQVHAVALAETPATIAAATAQRARGRVVSLATVSRAIASPSAPAQPNVITGVPASPGIAAGVAFNLVRPVLAVSETATDALAETTSLELARASVRAELSDTVRTTQGSARDIASAHLEFLEDAELLSAAEEWIARGKSAGYAWRSALRAYAEVIASLPDPRMAERAADLHDLEYQVLAALTGKSSSAAFVLPERAIVLAKELLPSQFVALDKSRLAGICTAAGGPTSHVAVLAASLDVPMLVAVGADVLGIPNGAPLILDADHGWLHVSPTPAELKEAERLVAERQSQRIRDRQNARTNCHMADGVRIEVFANAASVAEAEAAVAQGAEGCGLLRTEFLFLDRTAAPDENTQAVQYQAIVEAFGSRPVVIRTLDAGADKPLTYLTMPREENPSLGVRGIRASLRSPELLRTQLRAILRVRPVGACRILLPMVTDPAEVREVRRILDELRGEMSIEARIPLGAMVETPAAALLADQLASEADFLSIGTNDLTQYTLAMDRGNPALAARLDSLHPAVLRLIEITARAGRAANRDVAVCGGLASDPAAAAILIGLGVNELSAVPSVVPRLKAQIRTLTLSSCQALANRAVQADSAAAVRALVSNEVHR
jgi:phosphocarrier protein FPr/phosphocarrier protein